MAFQPSESKAVLVLTENWTLTPPRDLRRLVELAVEAEAAGVDAVMLSEHIVLGPAAGEAGRMENPREYALPGNQDPATPWPNSLILLAAIAAATTRLRLVAGAVIAPLRHPLLLARELGTLDLLAEGRLVVLPTVSWHREEYEALGVSFERRGELLDEHLAAWRNLWRDTPASFTGEHYRFSDVFMEPKAWRESGPRLWFGGSTMHPRMIRRLVEYGHGLNPLGGVSDADLGRLAEAMRAAGRDPSELELVGGLRGEFGGPDETAALEPALERARAQAAQGFTSFCFKPNQYIDDVGQWGPLCRRVVAGVRALHE
jgi:probable F420-dependent oxidoreductase